MKCFLRPLLVLVFSLLQLAVPFSANAEGGPIRQRLKERMAERQQANQQPHNDDRQAASLQPGHHTDSIQHDGLKRMYRLYIPASYNPSKPAAIVIALHGGGGNMDYQADDARYGLISKADKEGFVVVFPNGYSKLRSGKFATWNAGKCCGAARDENIDDVGFIRTVLERIASQVSVDRQRIYATGMSNGGLMSYRLACEMPGVFKAIAPVAGTDNTVTCSPARPVSVLHIHAKNDTHVLFTGGSGMDSRKAAVTDFTSVSDTIEKWRDINACPAAPQRVLEKAGAYCDLYAPCRNNTQVKLCVTETGGHSWPGASKTRNEPASQALSATEMMWDFFSKQ
jgi:polyhydroxybutyrate depolymerase